MQLFFFLRHLPRYSVTVRLTVILSQLFNSHTLPGATRLQFIFLIHGSGVQARDLARHREPARTPVLRTVHEIALAVSVPIPLHKILEITVQFLVANPAPIGIRILRIPTASMGGACAVSSLTFFHKISVWLNQKASFPLIRLIRPIKSFILHSAIIPQLRASEQSKFDAVL